MTQFLPNPPVAFNEDETPPGSLLKMVSDHGVAFAIFLGVCAGLGVSLDAFSIAAVMVGGLVFFLSFRYPGLILSALLAMMLFQRFQMIQFGLLGVPMSLAKLSALMCIVVFVGQALVYRKRIVVLDRVSLGLMAVVAAFLISTLAADDPMESRRRMMSMLLLTTLTNFTYRFVRREHVRLLINLLPVILGVLCAVGVWDLVHGGVWSRATEISADAEIIRGGGSFGDPNVWASVNLFFLPLALLHFAHAKRFIVRSFDFVVLLGLITNIGLSFSRAGYLVLGAIMVTLLWQERQRPWLALLVGGAALAILIYLLPLEVIEQRFNRLFMMPNESGPDSSLYQRYQVLVGGLDVFLENPLWGVGPSQYGNYVSYGGMDDYGKSAHNIYMQVLVEVGLLGAFAFILLGRGVYDIWKRLRYAQLDPWARDFFRYINLSFFSYILMGATLNILFHSYMWFMLGVGLSAGRWAFEQPEGLEATLPKPARKDPTAGRLLPRKVG